MITIRFPTDQELPAVQLIFNHKSVIQWLGGFTMMDTLKTRNKDKRPSLWLAETDEEIPFGESNIIGAFTVAGRSLPHLLRLGEAGVPEQHRRKRIGSTFYIAAIMQGILEGKRLFEITIVGDSPTQFHLLPTLGFTTPGELRHRTASTKSISIFQLSLLDDTFNTLISRLPDYKIHLKENDYTKESWDKNMEVYKKHIPEFIPKIEQYREHIKTMPNISIMR